VPADTTDSGGKVKVNILKYITGATLDVIGLAGFNYPFNALNATHNEFSVQFTFLLDFMRDLRFHADKLIFQLLKGKFRLLRHISFDEQSRRVELAQSAIMKISRQVLAESKKQIAQDNDLEMDGKGSKEEMEMASGAPKGKDLLSLLLKANAKSFADGEKGLSDEELMHQIPSFLLAGEFILLFCISLCMFQ
jgi:cytochrome P450